MKIVACALAIALAVTSQAGTLTIDAAHSAGRVSPRLYGLMTEEINHSYDGGLYAELIRNRAFLDDAHALAHWSLVKDGSADASLTLDPGQPLNSAIPTSLRVDVKTASAAERAGFANEGYWGIPVLPNTKYRASFFAKTTGYSGGITLSIESGDGRTVYASGEVRGLGPDWREYDAVLSTGASVPTTARYVIRLDRPGTVWFSFVSLFPPTWNDRPNGLRKDLMQKLVDLSPKFLRFPGGNYLEGNTIAERFEWKKTIGPLSERPGHESPWGYRSTDGLGLLEFLEWCEDMKAEPVLAVYAGYSLEQQRIAAGTALAPYVQDALDEIEYVTGDPASSRWGAVRARDGHPAPFPLHFVEIGNEDGFDKANTYDARFTQFFRAIKARYPGLECLSTVSSHDAAEKQVHSCQPDLFDHHYYNAVDEFLRMGRSQYESYPRTAPKIFVGEWASYETPFPPWNERSAAEPPTPNLRAALGDAAFMTDLERNSDVVIMHCYAPLLVNVNPGGRQWRPDLIGYDALSSFGSPSYYAFRMFSTQVGDEILKTSETGTAVFASATRVGPNGVIYLKLVNATSQPEPLRIHVDGGGPLASTASVSVLAAPSSDATNAIDRPTAVVPAATTLTGVGSDFDFTVPANGIAVLTLQPSGS